MGTNTLNKDNRSLTKHDGGMGHLLFLVTWGHLLASLPRF